jgi:NADH-quinone oxidoreductase subunit A
LTRQADPGIEPAVSERFVRAHAEVQAKMSPYVPFLHLLIMMAIAIAFAGLFGLLSKLLGPKRPLPEKLTTYETGIAAEGTFLGRFNVKFCVVAVLFLLFDLEVVFLYPGAVVLEDVGYRGLIEVAVFLLVLFVGWAFAIGSGVLNWGTPSPRWHRREK